MPRKSRKATSDGLKRGEGYIREEQRADGSTRYKARWYERQLDGTQKLITRSFNRRDDAEDHLRQTARDKRDGRYVSAADVSVGRVVLDYLERGEHGWKSSTYATYRQRAYSHIIPALGDIRLVELTTARVQHWIDQLTRRRKIDDHAISAKTIEEATRLLGGAMQSAVQLDLIRTNPVRGVSLPKARQKQHRTWTDDHMATVLATVADDPMWHALYRVALLTGIRPGEARALQWPDVDLDARTITVRRTITRGTDNREIVGESTKTGRDRSLALPASAADALRLWRVQQARLQLAAESWDSRRFVFTGKNGQFLGGTTWHRQHVAIIAQAGVPAIGVHEMRHSNATVELAAGTHPKIVSDRLGHARIETTLNLYSHVSPDLQRAAIDALDERIGIAAKTTTSG
jgi:integrase